GCSRRWAASTRSWSRPASGRAADGLRPSAQGKRIAFDGAGRTVVDGPFAAPRELVAGFWAKPRVRLVDFPERQAREAGSAKRPWAPRRGMKWPALPPGAGGAD